MTSDSQLVEKIILSVMHDQAKSSSAPVKCNDKLYGTCTHGWDCPSHKSDVVSQIISAGACRVGNALGSCEVTPNVARMIDHTLLKPEGTREEIIQLCKEAKEFQFASVCINPGWVSLAAKELKDSKVDVCTVIGFPLGATSSKIKALETRIAIEDGATEVDMVINVGFLKSKMYDEVEADIRSVVEAASCSHVLTKVILETCLLTDEEKVIACILSKNAEANFVKTSTGFSKGGATVQDIALMRKVVGPLMGVKASGGVRSFDDAEKMIAHGASRIGASASVAIVKHEETKSTY